MATDGPAGRAGRAPPSHPHTPSRRQRPLPMYRPSPPRHARWLAATGRKALIVNEQLQCGSCHLIRVGHLQQAGGARHRGMAPWLCRSAHRRREEVHSTWHARHARATALRVGLDEAAVARRERTPRLDVLRHDGLRKAIVPPGRPASIEARASSSRYRKEVSNLTECRGAAVQMGAPSVLAQ